VTVFRAKKLCSGGDVPNVWTKGTVYSDRLFLLGWLVDRRVVVAALVLP